jgi:hypothetical protein
MDVYDEGVVMYEDCDDWKEREILLWQDWCDTHWWEKVKLEVSWFFTRIKWRIKEMMGIREPEFDPFADMEEK